LKIDNVLQVVDPAGLTYYMGTITPPEIMQLTFVPCVVRVNEDVLNVRTQDGYQREGDKKRMSEISDFYAKNLSSLIPPVLLSTRGKWKFTPQPKTSAFGTIEAQDCAAVIDGQHRLGGLSMLCTKEGLPNEALMRTIPFMAIEFADVPKESQEFEVINGRQKGIKPSHLKYIKRSADFTGNAANMLKEDEDSVFFGRIAIAERHDWDLITFGAACELVDLTFDSYFCSNTLFRPKASEEAQAKALIFLQNYWKAVAQAFDGMWHEIHILPPVGSTKSAQHPGRTKFKFRVLEETGLRAIASLGSRVLRKAWMDDAEDISWPSVDTFLQKVANDTKVNLVMQKLKPENKEAILAIDARFQMQGKAGAAPLIQTLLGALDKV
jgi:DGQHR domain-containing protein